MPKVSDLFEIHSGYNLDLVNLEEDPKGVNYIARGSTNNGVVTKVKQPVGFEVYQSGCITCPVDGSILTAFVQDSPFITGQNVSVLIPKRNMLNIEKWFYCYCLRVNATYFNYGRKANRYLKDIELPDKIPDWVYECKLDLPQTKVNSEIPELHTENWKSFKLGDLFDMELGTFVSKPDSEFGSIESLVPYVGTSDDNNGIVDFIDFPRQSLENFNLNLSMHKRFSANKITVGVVPYVKYAFYQNSDFAAYNRVQVLSLKSCDMTPEIGLFICTMLRFAFWRFSSAYSFRDRRLLGFEIKLPVTSAGEPDWNFMKLYMRSLPYSDLIKDI